MLTDDQNFYTGRLGDEYGANFIQALKICRYTTLWNMDVSKLAAIWNIYCD